LNEEIFSKIIPLRVRVRISVRCSV